MPYFPLLSMAGRAALSILAALLTQAPASAAEVIPGRCHMDVCAWFSVEEKDLVGTDRHGALFRVVTKAWQSTHPDGAYNRRSPRRGGGAATSYVLCSKQRPALLDAAPGGRWSVTELDLGPDSEPPGALETSTSLYFAVCHAVAAPDTGEALIGLARRFRYPAPSGAGQPLPETVDRPEAILRR